jgi:hypothetical protein
MMLKGAYNLILASPRVTYGMFCLCFAFDWDKVCSGL